MIFESETEEGMDVDEDGDGFSDVATQGTEAGELSPTFPPADDGGGGSGGGGGGGGGGDSEWGSPKDSPGSPSGVVL